MAFQPVELPKVEPVPEHPVLFVRSVQRKLRGEHGKFDEFLAILLDFIVARIGLDVVVGRIEVLFDGHPDLILGFNRFLPSGYGIEVPQEAEEAVAGEGTG